MQRPARALLAALVFAPLAACSPPLAIRDAWFNPLNRAAERAEDDARAAVRRYRAAQAARRDCLPAAVGAAPPSAPAGAEPCPPPGAAPGAFGAAANAYRRWAADAVRELPVLSDTAAGAAGE